MKAPATATEAEHGPTERLEENDPLDQSAKAET